MVLRSTQPGPIPSGFQEHAFLYTSKIPDGTYCMTAEMAAMEQFKLQLWYMIGNVLQKDKIFDSVNGLNVGFDTLQFTIEKSVLGGETFRLVIFTVGTDARKTSVALKSLSLQSGKCLQKGEYDSFPYHILLTY